MQPNIFGIANNIYYFKNPCVLLDLRFMNADQLEKVGVALNFPFFQAKFDQEKYGILRP